MLQERHPFWSAWTRVVIRHPWAVIVVSLAVTAVFGVVAWRTPKDLSFTGLIPESDVEMAEFRRAIDTFGADTNIVILLEGERGEINRAIGALNTALADMPAIKTITPPAESEWLIERAPWVWPRALLEAAVEAARTGNASNALIANIDGADAIIRKSLQPVERASLYKVGLKVGPLQTAMGGSDYFEIERIAERTLEDGKFDVTFGFTGLAAAAAQDQRNVLSRIRILSPITLIAVLILLMGVERRLSRVAMAGIALSCSVVFALGMTGFVVGRLSITVTFFGVLLLGLGIDFAIHLLVALRDARSHGNSPEESVQYAIRHTATAITLGGLTTALAFGLVSLAPEAGARDMGLAALFGLVSALVLMLTFLPATWLLLERRHANLEVPPRFYLPGLKSVADVSLKFPRIIAAIGLFCVLFGIAGIPRYELERDLEKIISRTVTSFDVDKRLEELFGVSPVTYIAPVNSIEEAREVKKRLLELDEIAVVSSVADVVLPDSAEREAALDSLFSGSPGEEGDSAVRERLRRAYQAGPITLDNVPHSFSSGVVGDHGELALSIVPKTSTLDAAILAGRTERIREAAPTATGLPVIIRLVAMGGRDYIPIMIVGILVTVTVVLAVAFRDARDVFLALSPVLVGAGAGFGVLLWFDLHMSVLTGAVVPVILGLGVDDGIHVVERLRQSRVRDDATIHEAVEGVGRAIFLTTATTCVSFVVFLFTDHAGLEGISWFMLISMPVCFIASVVVLPAVAKLLAHRSA
jgi:predicted RND superfamily exporter protein